MEAIIKIALSVVALLVICVIAMQAKRIYDKCKSQQPASNGSSSRSEKLLRSFPPNGISTDPDAPNTAPTPYKSPEYIAPEYTPDSSSTSAPVPPSTATSIPIPTPTPTRITVSPSASAKKNIDWRQIFPQLRLPEFDTSTVAQGHMTFRNLHATGRGSFGQVYRATADGDRENTYALKRQIWRLDSNDVGQYLRRQNRQLDCMRREGKIYFSATLNSGQTPHLALLSGIAFAVHTYTDGSIIKEPVLAMQWANAEPHNTLKAWMKANPVSEHLIQVRVSLAIQMYSGLVELHRGGHHPNMHIALEEEKLPLFVHQDIKPANMLLFGHSPDGSGPFRLALTDFGLSVCYNGTETEAKCEGGTRFYMAPEQWLGKAARSTGRDIWAAGMVLAELFAGKAVMQVLREYNMFCSRFRQMRTSATDSIRRVWSHRDKLVRAIGEDIMFATDSNLLRVQHAIAPTLLNCFRDGIEIRGAMLPGHGRPTALKCESTLISAWEETLNLQQWSSYQTYLPRPKPTALQQMLLLHGRYKLANHYLEHMEIGMLTMMRCQCERLLSKVNPSDRVVVDNHMKNLDSKLLHAHTLKAEQEALSAVCQPKVSKRASLMLRHSQSASKG